MVCCVLPVLEELQHPRISMNVEGTGGTLKEEANAKAEEAKELTAGAGANCWYCSRRRLQRPHPTIQKNALF